MVFEDLLCDLYTRSLLVCFELWDYLLQKREINQFMEFMRIRYNLEVTWHTILYFKALVLRVFEHYKEFHGICKF